MPRFVTDHAGRDSTTSQFLFGADGATPANPFESVLKRRKIYFANGEAKIKGFGGFIPLHPLTDFTVQNTQPAVWGLTNVDGDFVNILEAGSNQGFGFEFRSKQDDIKNLYVSFAPIVGNPPNELENDTSNSDNHIILRINSDSQAGTLTIEKISFDTLNGIYKNGTNGWLFDETSSTTILNSSMSISSGQYLSFVLSEFGSTDLVLARHNHNTPADTIGDANASEIIPIVDVDNTLDENKYALHFMGNDNTDAIIDNIKILGDK